MDLFAAFGTSLARAHRLNSETGEIDVLSIEDLAARTTALVCGHLRRCEDRGDTRIFLGRAIRRERCDEMANEPMLIRPARSEDAPSSGQSSGQRSERETPMPWIRR